MSLSVQLEHTEIVSSLSANDLYCFVCNVDALCVSYHVVESIDEQSSQPCVEGGVRLSKRPS